MGSAYKAIKTSDRFHAGISDWLVFHKGKVAAIEAKFVSVPSKRGKLLKHPVSGPQQTFMKVMRECGVPGYALIGFGDTRRMVTIPIEDIPPSGNWTVDEFFLKSTSSSFWWTFNFNEVPNMMHTIFII
jgi:hypothetical protein